ncbi:F0F1 ATP synthase subunit B family protein [Frigidibacter sp. ROC022]|uniref:F0F1 ATP synthase subunit B family protein n=1 Tax=Frigidibacter sp. ROC022 TaxID=2971796 RepID=UPI00215A56A8|nr:F0F1 ATP synthase subunit delta [Frigidibacter sp. ROC022]MCR8723802.1 F0F1 ATP synthase subunit delta [Frigidibacter sp. ROC022]
MTIDFWGLGLQAINFLILVWLLTRVFWRPVAAAIVARQTAARSLLNEGKSLQAKADAALAEVAEIRAGMAAEREALLAKAATEAETATKAVLAEARDKADKLIAAAELARKRDAEAARAREAARSAELAVDIARRLLDRLPREEVQAAFLDLLVKALTEMKPQDRAALQGAREGIELVGPTDLEAAEQARIAKAVQTALGGPAKLRFVTEPELIAGFELRTSHFVLHNSWQADLDAILKELKHAA